MKAFYRITIPQRRKELAALVEAKLVEFEQRPPRCFAHTYPHRSLSEAITVDLIVMEKGEPHLMIEDKNRRERMVRVVLNAHEKFDRENKWNDGYPHDKAAQFLVDAVIRAEVRTR